MFSIRSVYAQCTLSIPTVYSQYTHSIRSAYPQYIRSVYAQCTLSICSVYPQYICSVYPLWSVLLEVGNACHDGHQFSDHQLLLSQHVVPLLPLHFRTLVCVCEGVGGKWVLCTRRVCVIQLRFVPLYRYKLVSYCCLMKLVTTSDIICMDTQLISMQLHTCTKLSIALSLSKG